MFEEKKNTVTLAMQLGHWVWMFPKKNHLLSAAAMQRSRQKG